MCFLVPVFVSTFSIPIVYKLSDFEIALFIVQKIKHAMLSVINDNTTNFMGEINEKKLLFNSDLDGLPLRINYTCIFAIVIVCVSLYC